MKILVAEDELQNKLLIERVLTKLGHECTIVDSGEEVVDLVNDTSYDVIILDISLPGMDGIETTKYIRTNANVVDNNVPIIVLSGNSEEYLQGICDEHNMNGYVTKPFRFADIKDALNNVVSN